MAAVKPNDWTQFLLKIYINKPVAKVFDAWTNDKIVTKWFTEKTVIEKKKGGRLYFEWLAGDKLDATVTSIVKNRSFTFPFGSKGEKVTVKFKKSGRGCICELCQFDMKTDAKTKWNMHRGCIQGWTFFLANLKSYLEHGIDLRSHDPKQSYKQDFINS